METGRRVAEFYSAILTPFSVPGIESIVFSWFSPTEVGPAGAITSAAITALVFVGLYI